jgi:hypothetical protein
MQRVSDIQLYSPVFENRPVFRSVLEENGHASVFDYAKRSSSFSTKVKKERQSQFLSSLSEHLHNLFGPTLSNVAIEELEDHYYVSTADHHGPLVHPFFFNNTLLQSLVNRSHGKKCVFSFACAGISLNNSSFPRGLFYHNRNLGEERLHFFSLQNRHHPVFGHQAYSPDTFDRIRKETENSEHKKKMLEILEKTFFNENVNKSGSIYSDQVSRGNFFLWKLLPGQEETDLVYVEQERLVAELIVKHHLEEITEINSLLFNPAWRKSYAEQFDGIIGALSRSDNKGTFLFWGIHNHKRIQLVLSGNELVNDTFGVRVPLTPAEIMIRLQQHSLMPSMALSFIVLSFYYGLTCGGGFNQVNYLTEMKRAWQNVLSEHGADQGELAGLQTDHLSADMALAFLSDGKDSVPASSVDLMLYGDDKTWDDFVGLSREVTLDQAIGVMMPEYYKITTGKNLTEKTHTIRPTLYAK